MTSRFPQWNNHILAGLALVWPLQIYGYVPALDVTLPGILLTVGIVFWLLHWRNTPVRTPLEYWWPMIAACALSVYATREAYSITLLLAFVVAVQGSKNREQTERLMMYSVQATGLFALIAALGATLDLGPTSYTIASGIAMHGAVTIPDGIYILALGLGWAVYLLAVSTLSPTEKAATFFSGFVCLGAVGGKLLLVALSGPEWSNASISSRSGLELVITALVAWLSLRIIAKLWVTRETKSGLSIALGLTLITSVLYWCLVPFEMSLYHGLLLGIIAGYALPDRDDTVGVATPIVPALMAVVLLFINVNQSYPNNERDARNVAFTAQAQWGEIPASEFHQRMANLLLMYPAKAEFIYAWMAQASVELEELDRASKELTHAAALDDETRLDLLRVALRDGVATTEYPESTLAYERALVGMGERGSALVLLKLKIETGALNLPDDWNRSAQASVYAALLGDKELADEISEWDVLDIRVGDGLWSGIRGDVPEGEKTLAWFVDQWPNETRLYVIYGNDFRAITRRLKHDWEATPLLLQEDDFNVNPDDPDSEDAYHTISIGEGAIAHFILDGDSVRGLEFVGEQDLGIRHQPTLYISTAYSE